MNMKKFFLVSMIVMCVAGALFAQENTTPTVVLENGFVGGYGVTANSIGTAFRLGLAVTLGGPLQAEFSFVNNASATFTTFNLLSLNYSIIPLLGVSVYMGQDAATAAYTGVGIYSDVLGKAVAGSLQTGLRIRVDYLSPLATGFQNGYLLIGVSMLLGI